MKSRGPIIAAAAGVLVSVLVAVGLILPKMGQVKKVQDQVDRSAGADGQADAPGEPARGPGEPGLEAPGSS